MKPKLFLAAIAAVFIALHANAKIWRVNNFSNYNGTSLWGDNYGGTAGYPVFKKLNDAIAWAGVNNGDTLYVEPSSLIYATATITKKLAIIGPGYFLEENPNTSDNASSASIAHIEFNAGSDGSQLIGVNAVNSSTYGDGIHLNASNLTVKRCRIELSVVIGTSVSDIFIIQNFFSNKHADNAIVTSGVFGYVYPTGLIFNNNICQKTLSWPEKILQCNNNIFDGPQNVLNIQVSTTSFKNNILKSIGASVNINNNSHTNVSYNIGTLATQFGTENNNKVVANMATLFVGSGTTDGLYKLKANSAGSNNGSDGTDRGAFGGAAATNRYTLSGLPPIPVIYNVSTSGVATAASGLPITISARTIK